MRKFALLTMLITMPLLAAPAVTWESYGNARFGFHLDYAARLMKPQPEAQNGDGREFHAVHGTARFAAYGNFVDDSKAFAADVSYPEQQCAGGKATYKLMRPTTWTVSCPTAKGMILFHKAIFAKGAESHFEATYPPQEKTTWDPIVTHMASSLSAPDPAE